MSLDKIHERIRRCLAVSSDGAASQQEIETALRVANSLMLKHNIERDDVVVLDDCQEIDVSRIRFGKHPAFFYGKRRTLWQSGLADFLTELSGATEWYFKTAQIKRENGIVRKQGTVAVFYGPDADAQFCADLFEELVLATVTMAKLRWGGWTRGDGAAYCEGFIDGLRATNLSEKEKQLREARPEQRSLIVLAEEKGKLIKQGAKTWLAGQGIRLSAGSGLSGCDGSNKARREGRQDGSTYSLAGRKATLRIS